jgi:hypothetical protein
MDTGQRPGFQSVIASTSLILGPALMTAGDLIHPAESLDASAQVAIVAQAASRWYAAHLLLFIGFLVLVPGILMLTELVAERRPAMGYTARVLMLVSLGAFCAVFVFEMLLGRLIATGTGGPAGMALLETFQSAAVFPVLVPGLLAFFVGVAFFVVPLASAGNPFRWPALCFGLGALLILAEIVSAQVVLSQIGNALAFVASTAFALLQRRGVRAVPG